MHREIFSGKTIDEAKNKALETLKINESDVIFIEKDQKKSLFTKKAEIEAITKQDIIKYIKETLNKIVLDMGINNQIEVKNRDDVLIFNIIGDKKEILIGKQGRTLSSLQILMNQIMKQELGVYYRFQIDACDYKYNKQQRLEKLAKYTAKDVARNHCEVKLDPMNSYERRIIHNALSNSKDVYTESIGEEPNRCVIIKLKEDK